ncbi:MAG: DUF2252 family protein [bacterium]
MIGEFSITPDEATGGHISPPTDNLNPNSLDVEHIEAEAARLMAEIKSGERVANPEMVKMCRKVITKVLIWAEREGIKITNAERLGDTCLNPVLMIQTSDGRLLVAKGFSDEHGAEHLWQARYLIDQWSLASEMQIPEAIKWITEDVFVTEKVSGCSIKKEILDSLDRENGHEHAKHIASNLGKMLCTIHSHNVEKLEQPVQMSVDYVSGSKESIVMSNLSLIIQNLEVVERMGAVDFASLGCTKEALQDRLKATLQATQCSLVHGDAHFENFFYESNKSILSVIDYDTVNFGDPASDLGRARASLVLTLRQRDCNEAEVQSLLEAFDQGYLSKINQSEPNNSHLELQKEMVRAYEIRMYLANIVHKMHRPLREKVASKISEISNISGLPLNDLGDLLHRITDSMIGPMQLAHFGFSPEEIARLINMSESQKQIEMYVIEMTDAKLFDLLRQNNEPYRREGI